jgi:hypothetical protein
MGGAHLGVEAAFVGRRADARGRPAVHGHRRRGCASEGKEWKMGRRRGGVRREGARCDRLREGGVNDTTVNNGIRDNGGCGRSRGRRAEGEATGADSFTYQLCSPFHSF